MAEPDAVQALERGFGSFRARSRSPRRPQVSWPELPPDFFKDMVGLIGVKDGHGLLLEEAFPVDVVPIPRERILGARRRVRRRLQAWLPRHSSPVPKRRYFRSAVAHKVEQDASWQVAATAAAVEMGRVEESAKDAGKDRTPPDFLPLLTAASQLNVASWGASCRSARLAALRQRCQQTPGDAEAWLDFAEFQWSQLGEELDAPAKQVREKQRAVLEAALSKQSGPPDVRLIRALATAEGDGTANMPVQELLACRRQRLLQCSHAEVAEELVWGFLEICTLGGAGHKDGSLLEGAPLLRGLPAPESEPAPIESLRRAVSETLAFLAVRKVAAGHDGQAIAALERAELACISSLVMAEAASGRSQKAIELLRGLATWNLFGQEGDPNFFASIWKARCRLGSRGALRALQQMGALQAQLPEALQPLAQTLDALEDACDAIEKPPAGHFCAMLRAGGGRVRNWCADELQRSMGLKKLGEDEPEMTFEELQPFLLFFRMDESKKELVLRLLDLLGAPTLHRHPPSSRYRQSFMEAFAPLSLRFSEETRIPPHGMLPACAHREAMKTHVALQSLAMWPKEPVLHEVLVESLRQLSSHEVFNGQAAKLPRRVLRASEDPRLYFIYAHGLWQSGAAERRDETRAVLLKLCGTVDARIAMAWWYLELTSAESSCAARAQRLVLALAFGCFDEGVLSDAPLNSRETGLSRLQALARLQQLLPRSSRNDGSSRFLLSSYQAVVLATCALLAPSSARKAVDFFLKEVPPEDPMARTSAMSRDAGFLRPTAASRASLTESSGWSRAAEQMLVLMTLVQAPVKIRLEVIRLCLRLDPGSPLALRHLTKLRLQQGLVNTLRRELDDVLGLHRATRLGQSPAQWLESFRVSLHTELLLDASGGKTGSHASGARRSALCERAMMLASPAATGNLWCLYGLMLLLKLQREGRGAAELWRCGVRATSRVPLQKVAWLLHLAACEARALPGDAPEEEVIDLVEAVESKQIFLHSDPLEAIA